MAAHMMRHAFSPGMFCFKVTCILPRDTVRTGLGVRAYHCWSSRGLTARQLMRYSSLQMSYSSDMSKKTYWDEFYTRKKATNDGSFDWFFSHDVANQWLAKYIFEERTSEQVSPVMNVLELGCGTSTLASNLLRDKSNTMNVVSTDFSSAAVIQAQTIIKKTCLYPKKSKESVHFVIADATSLPFRTNQFDVVFEKGTFDAMLTGNNHSLARTSFSETVRVLTPQGTFLQFSDESPELRLSFFEEALQRTNIERKLASVTFQDIGCSFGIEYFLYVIKFFHS